LKKKKVPAPSKKKSIIGVIVHLVLYGGSVFEEETDVGMTER